MAITVTHAFVSAIADDPAAPQEVRPSDWNAAHVVNGASLTITDGSHTVADVTQIAITGGVVGGSTPDATLTITGAGVSLPLPFFGSNPPWNGATTAFTSWLNQGTSTVTPITDGPLVFQGNALGGSLPSAYISARLRALPSPPYTVTMAVAAVYVLPSSQILTNKPPQQIVLYDSVSDTAFTIGLWSPLSGISLRQITTASNPSGASVTTIGAWYSNTAYFGYIQIKNDGTNITLSYGAEGLAYIPFLEDTIANFGATFNEIGFGADLALIAQNLSSVTDADDPSTGATSALIPLWNFTQTSP